MCKCSCPQQWPHAPEEWCGECQLDYSAWIDEQVEQERLARLADDFAAIKPATETEWRRRLDELAPCIEEWAL